MAFLLYIGFCGYGVMRKVGRGVGCPLSGRYVSHRINFRMNGYTKWAVLFVAVVVTGCDGRVKTESESVGFFISSESVSGIPISDLVSSLENLPNQVGGCDAVYQKPTNELLIQCSKRGFNYTNGQVEAALSQDVDLKVAEIHGQLIYKWSVDDINCSIAIEEENDIFELWCGRGT
ncbi:hypothetical protein ACHELU_004390 [Vibrio vulnificus]